MRLALLLLLTACTEPAAAPVRTLAASFEPQATAPRFGRYRVLWPHSLCQRTDRGGYAVVRPDYHAPPTVGRSTQVMWATELLGPRPEIAMGFLLVSFGSGAPVRLDTVGFPGCVMHVDPSPRNLWAIPAAPGSIVTLDGPRMWLDWTPGAEFLGQQLRIQPLLGVHGATQNGWLWGPAVEVWVGG